MAGRNPSSTSLTEDQAIFLRDVHTSLDATPKSLPSKYFYDQTGSALFDQICELEEYYLTRTEIAILQAHAAEMAECLGPRVLLIEYGSGSSTKIRTLLDQLDGPAGYAPIDVSCEHLRRAAAAIDADYPELAVFPVCADFTASYDLPAVPHPGRRIAYFPGSTIGNFSPPETARLLRGIASVCGASGGALIAADLKKDRTTLERAYNDAAGVTAAFNRNIIARINREFGADFDLDRFAHRAFYHEETGRIEMHLDSLAPQTVTVLDRSFDFDVGESIRTEYSYKYSLEEFASVAEAAGLRVKQVWTDPQYLFSVHYLTPLAPGEADR